jgi:hypothetical protein
VAHRHAGALSGIGVPGWLAGMSLRTSPWPAGVPCWADLTVRGEGSAAAGLGATPLALVHRRDPRDRDRLTLGDDVVR